MRRRSRNSGHDTIDSIARVGQWRSLVAYLNGVQVVVGSNPACPTNFINQLRIDGGRVFVSQQTQQNLRIVIENDIAQGTYVNFANIMHSPSEFVVDLGRIVPGRTDVKIHQRVIMTPLHTKQLLGALAQNIRNFEEKYGEIRTDMTQPISFEPSSSNEPSN